VICIFIVLYWVHLLVNVSNIRKCTESVTYQSPGTSVSSTVMKDATGSITCRLRIYKGHGVKIRKTIIFTVTALWPADLATCQQRNKITNPVLICFNILIYIAKDIIIIILILVFSLEAGMPFTYRNFYVIGNNSRNREMFPIIPDVRLIWFQKSL
jgi:hypothetical protein